LHGASTNFADIVSKRYAQEGGERNVILDARLMNQLRLRSFHLFRAIILPFDSTEPQSKATPRRAVCAESMTTSLAANRRAILAAFDELAERRPSPP
jgi:hypothetical protein